MSKKISLHFHGEFDKLLPPDQRNVDFNHELKETRSVKDLIESIGVPHTEIDIIIVNDESVNFEYLVKPNDRIQLYPTSRQTKAELINISPLIHCQPEPLTVPRFVLDVHLGKLAAYLRMLGFDSLYRNDYDDPTLATISANEQRTLLTCDRQLLMRKQVSHGYFVRARQPQQQLLEVLSRFYLFELKKPFTRCMHCNGITQAVSKQEIETQLLPATKKHYNKFFQCISCKKIYWEGSHYLKMQAEINKLKAGEI
ncbi:MAG: Mut7-C ubiquitin/RNAse domain-containing protein [Gammaproteobacteria bacterium]|nr:Mut7-C ubiquitin/RNAse domain-containing protein [Gammaproteobacteria bacterium]